MTDPEHDPGNNPNFPFEHDKIPVVEGLEGFKSFINHFPGFTFCPYLAAKDAEGWDESTSRTYMNQVLPKVLYVPVNIPAGAPDQMRAMLEFVRDDPNILAVNITQPHKNSPILRELFLGSSDGDDADSNIDALIRSETGELRPHNLNPTAFVEWYKTDVGQLRGKSLVLLGVGGTGQPIARSILAEHPSSLSLVDVTDRSDFARQLTQTSKVPVKVLSSLEGVDLPPGTILISAAGKEGATNESGLRSALEHGTPDGIFVDIRPRLDVDMVELAEENGWQAYSGHGMNVLNNYVLMWGMAAQIQGVEPPTFEKFQRLVKRAS